MCVKTNRVRGLNVTPLPVIDCRFLGLDTIQNGSVKVSASESERHRPLATCPVPRERLNGCRGRLWPRTYDCRPCTHTMLGADCFPTASRTGICCVHANVFQSFSGACSKQSRQTSKCSARTYATIQSCRGCRCTTNSVICAVEI